MPNKKQLGLLISATLGLGGLIAIPGFAQDSSLESEEELLLEEVIVTGTRLSIADGFGRTSPVTVVGMDEISSYGLTRIEDVLNELPQVASRQNSFVSNGTTGTATLDLRDLGPDRTLVLFNGRRMQPGGVMEQSVDVNQIPTAMIERVEVLTGGASATYGSDAVAGVVNFIMRRVSGVEIRAGISGYQHDNRNAYIRELMDARGFEYPTGNTGIDGKAYNIDVVIGGDFANGAGNATVYATWRDNEELRQEARDYSSCALNLAGTACGGSGNAAVPNFWIAPLVDGEMDWYQYGYLTLAPDSSLIDSVGNVYNYAPVNHFMRPDERWSLGAFIDYTINEHFVAYLETNFASDRTAGQIAESGTFGVEQYNLPLSNSLFPDAFRASLAERWPGYEEFGVYIAKRNVEGGPRVSIFEHDGFRIVTGIRGAISDAWDYDLSYLYGSTSSTQTFHNDFLAPKIAQAVNGELCAADPACIPYEVFTYQGVTPEQAEGLAGVAAMAGKTSTEVINGYVNGDLGFGLPSAADTIMVVAGFEFREEKFERVSDEIYEQGSLLGQGGASTPSILGQYSVDEFYAEANVPLLSDLPFARKMSLDLAYRWSEYSTAGRSNAYRAGIVWQTVDWLRVRTGYNRAVRAPNTNETFEQTQISPYGSYVDPCWGSTPLYTFEQCARTGVTAAQYGHILPSPYDSNNFKWGGNLELDPETADTITFGLVIDAADWMQVSLDYWDIEIDGVIGTVAAPVIMDQCALFNQFCSRIHRTDNGSLWLGREGYVDATRLNLGGQHYSGIDAALALSRDALGGTFEVDLIGTYWLTKETTLIPNDPNSITDCVGLVSAECNYTPTSKWRHNLSATYDSNSFWAVTGRWRYYSKVEYEGTTDLIVNDNLGAQSYFDLNAVFRFMQTHDVVVGVNNVFDREPPLAGGSLSWNGNTFAGFYDTLGRYLFANVTLRW